MKNNYKFEKLRKDWLNLEEDKEAIYSKMLEPTLSGDFYQVLNSVRDLETAMTSDYYYVAHKLVSYKGKHATFKGELYKATRNDLLSFLAEADISGNMRELLISPAHASPDRNIIYISEEAIYLYHST